MEIILISLCLATFLAFLLLKPLLTRITTTKVKLPPSPRRLPVIGNLHQLSLHPHRSLHSLSLRYGPLMLLHFGCVPVLVVSSADVAHDVMKTHDIKFSNRPRTKTVNKLLNGREVAFSPYGEYWRQAKSICVMNLLTIKTIQSFENIRAEEINTMMKKLEKASSLSSPINLSELFTTLTNDVIRRIVLGRKYGSERGCYISQDIVRRFVELMGAFPLGDFIPVLSWIDRIRGLDKKVEEVCNEFDVFMEKLVQEHEDADEDRSDFLYILLSLQRDKTTPIELDRRDLKLILLDMLFGASVTTFTLLEWTMTELMRHHECMKTLQDEIRSVSAHNGYVTEKEVEKLKYLTLVIKEVLRLHPSVPTIPRLLSEDVELHGYDIAAGTQVLINAWAIQRDIETWGPDAEKFRPERHLDLLVDFQGQNFKYIPFGSGRRRCPGIRFALALVEVTLANLVKRFDWRVEVGTMGDNKPDLAEAIGLDVCRKFPLVVCPSCV
ncbi:cytochrome P450 71A14-like [Brassica rapa]|uniref:Cytochrome P450 n=1 Tax=Brassica campestris TaxID=3711 RepID=M4DVC3_BRACM|nr:cytochrome P450 71A14-like [Brassica rapa]